MGGNREEPLFPAKGIGTRSLEPLEAIVAGTRSRGDGFGELGETCLHRTFICLGVVLLQDDSMVLHFVRSHSSFCV